MYNDYDLKLPITSIYLIAENKEDANSIKSQIKSLGYRGSTEETLGEQMLIMSDVLTMVLAGIAVVSLFVASIMILVVLYISVIERTKEIGLLRSIGARSKDIKRIFVSEAFLIGISGGIIGVVSAYIISIFVNMYSLREFQVAVMKITFYHSLTGLLLSTIVSMICGRFPAKKAANLDPVVALRTE